MDITKTSSLLGMVQHSVFVDPEHVLLACTHTLILNPSKRGCGLIKVIRKIFINHNKSFRWHLGDYEKHNFFPFEGLWEENKRSNRDMVNLTPPHTIKEYFSQALFGLNEMRSESQVLAYPLNYFSSRAHVLGILLKNLTLHSWDQIWYQK